MAFGQSPYSDQHSWGDAPGYGEKWPSAKINTNNLALRKANTVARRQHSVLVSLRIGRAFQGRTAIGVGLGCTNAEGVVLVQPRRRACQRSSPNPGARNARNQEPQRRGPMVKIRRASCYLQVVAWCGFRAAFFPKKTNPSNQPSIDSSVSASCRTSASDPG